MPDGYTAVDPREWTRVWLRIVASPSVKCTGMACAAFADYRTGANVRPGNELLCKVTGLSDKAVRDALRLMREWGFLWRYSEGKSKGTERTYDAYRLTFPEKLDNVPILSPDWELILWITLGVLVLITGTSREGTGTHYRYPGLSTGTQYRYFGPGTGTHYRYCPNRSLYGLTHTSTGNPSQGSAYPSHAPWLT